MVGTTKFHVVTPLHSYQKPEATFPLLPEACESELHPASTINVEKYNFQIGSWRNLAAAVNQNYPMYQNSYRCLHYQQNSMGLTECHCHSSHSKQTFFNANRFLNVKSDTLPPAYALSPIQPLAINMLFWYLQRNKSTKFNRLV